MNSRFSSGSWGLRWADYPRHDGQLFTSIGFIRALDFGYPKDLAYRYFWKLERRLRRFNQRDGLLRNHVSYITELHSGDLCLAYFEPLGIIRFKIEDGKLRILDHINQKKNGRLACLTRRERPGLIPPAAEQGP